MGLEIKKRRKLRERMTKFSRNSWSGILKFLITDHRHFFLIHTQRIKFKVIPQFMTWPFRLSILEPPANTHTVGFLSKPCWSLLTNVF